MRRKLISGKFWVIAPLGCWSQESNVQLTVVRGSQTMSEDGHEDVGEAGGGGREAYWATDQTIVPVLLMHGAASSL